MDEKNAGAGSGTKTLKKPSRESKVKEGSDEALMAAIVYALYGTYACYKGEDFRYVAIADML